MRYRLDPAGPWSCVHQQVRPQPFIHRVLVDCGVGLTYAIPCSQVVAQQHALLREHDIKHVLSVTPYAIPTFPDTVNYLVIPLLDIVSANLLEHLDACLAFIDAAVARRENVLVHCRAGVSRSASVVIAWCMRALGYSLPRAVAYVQAVRPIIEPNAGFMLQLQLFSELGNRVPDGDTRVAFLQWRLANRHQGDALAIGMSSSTR